MKQQWQRLELKIDALSLRERAMIFAAAAFTLVTILNTLVLDPLMAKHKQLSEKIKQEQKQIAAIQTQIQAKVKAYDVDPDGSNRERLQSLSQQSDEGQAKLLGMQKGLVSPDKMSALLGDLLKRNSRLQLVSLKTLPVSALNETSPQSQAGGGASEKPAKDAAPTRNAIYKHGVEIVVQGGYADMMNYLAQLEAMPWQLFWAKAHLQVDDYPKSTVTLTLFTLSLDKTWLNI